MGKNRRGPRKQFAALPWRRTPQGVVEVLLITSRETRRWVIPKGWGKKKEPGALAAAREALEETGVAGRIAETPIGKYRYEKLMKTGEPQPVRVEVYPLEVETERKNWPEKTSRDKLWIAADHAARLVDEPELKALLLSFQPAPAP